MSKCTRCGEATYVAPLHGDRGGPLMCFMCAGAWQAKNGRRRRLGDVVIKAIRAYTEGGGKWQDIENLRL